MPQEILLRHAIITREALKIAGIGKIYFRKYMVEISFLSETLVLGGGHGTVHSNCL